MRPNKSLDASGTSGLVIDNLSVTWLSPAASTQPLSRRRSKGKTDSLSRSLNGFAFSARLGADETWVVGRRANKSLNRSGFSGPRIRKTRMLLSLFPARLIPPLSRRRSKGKTDSLSRSLNAFAFSARLGADETCVVGRPDNKSLNRSGFSESLIARLGCLPRCFPPG